MGLDTTDDEFDAGEMKKFHTWRTYPKSDYNPLWVELKIDFNEEYLMSLKSGD